MTWERTIIYRETIKQQKNPNVIKEDKRESTQGSIQELQTFNSFYFFNYQYSLTLLLYCTCLCCHLCLEWCVVFLDGSESVHVFLLFVYICIVVGDHRRGLGSH